MIRWPKQGEGESGLVIAQNTWAHPSPSLSEAVRTLALIPGRAAFMLGPGNKAEAVGAHRVTIHAADPETPSAAVVLDAGVQRLELKDWRDEINTALLNIREVTELDLLETRERQLRAFVQEYGKADEVEAERKRLAEATPEDPNSQGTTRQLKIAARSRDVGFLASAARMIHPEHIGELWNDWQNLQTFSPTLEPEDEPTVLKLMTSDPKGMHPSIYRAKLHILPPGWTIDLDSGVVTKPKPTPAPPQPP